MNHILGVFGPWQLIFLLVIFGGIVVGIVALFSSSAKHKARAETLDSLHFNKTEKTSSSLADLERLNKLRESGALTDAEFEDEKKKILG